MDGSSHAFAGIGHNSALAYDPDLVAPHQARSDELAAAGALWLDLKEIEDEEKAQKARDFFDQVQKAAKAADESRKAEKKIHDDRSAEVQKRYGEILAPMDKLLAKLKPMLARYLAAKKAREEAEKAAAKAEARRKQEEAERLLREAENRNDVKGEAEAEALLKEANKAAKAAGRATKTGLSSATGGARTMAIRTHYIAHIEQDEDGRNMRRAFGFLMDDPDSKAPLLAEMERLCTAARRRKDGPTEIPGVTWEEKQGVA